MNSYVVLEIGAEGGSIALFRAADAPRFWMTTTETDLSDIVSEELEQDASPRSEPHVVPSFEDALEQLAAP